LRSNEKLIELQVIVAKTARNRRTAGEILIHKRTNYITLKPVLMVDYVVRNPKMLGNATRIVNVLNRTAATLHMLRHSFASREPSLVPKLHSQANYRMPIRAQHGRDSGRIHSTGHRNGNGRL
jgi:hypothetical protein